MIEDAARQVLPLRRNIKALVTAVTHSLQRECNTFIPVANAVLSVLASDPRTSCLYISLFIAVSPLPEIQKTLQDSKNTAAFHAGTIACCIASLHTAAERPDALELDELEQSLGSHSSDLVRRFGLAALVAAAGGNRGWTQERLDRLRHYRKDVSPFVAEAAQFTFPVTELSSMVPE